MQPWGEIDGGGLRTIGVASEQKLERLQKYFTGVYIPQRVRGADRVEPIWVQRVEGGDVCGPVVGYDMSRTIRDVGCDVLIERVDEFLARVVAQNDLDIASAFCGGCLATQPPLLILKTRILRRGR